MKKLAFAFVLMMTANWVHAESTPAPVPTADVKTGVRKPTENVNKFWDSLAWKQLSAEEQKLWAVLGWDAKKWHGEKSQAPASENKNWADLTKAEQDALTKLGYDQKSWDAK